MIRIKKIFFLSVNKGKTEKDVQEVRKIIQFYLMLLKIKKKRKTFNVERVFQEVYPGIMDIRNLLSRMEEK